MNNSNFEIVYRGQPSQTDEISPKSSIWVTYDKDFAKEYGDIKKYKLPKGLNILNTDDYSKWEELIDNFSDDGDYDEYKYEPSDEFISFLQSKGYDGFVNGDNILIFDKSLLKQNSITELKKNIRTLIRKRLNEEFKQSQSKSFDNINLKTEDVFDMIDYYDAYRDLYPGYSNPEDENKFENDYYFPTKENAYTSVNDILNFFNTLPNPIPIYRSIKVNSINDIDFDLLGDSWSYNKQSAINFATNQVDGNILLIGKTYFDNVDWNKTLKLYYHFSGAYDSYDEDEINIIDSEKIFDVKVEKI